ncbi:MAG: c-type cytochrome domain-containing protein, partial [Planctomycetota bacterium]
MIRCLLAICLLVVTTPYSRSQENTQDKSKEFFHDQVLPLLKKHCYTCHSHASGQMESGLALDWKSGWTQGGSRGPA